MTHDLPEELTGKFFFFQIPENEEFSLIKQSEDLETPASALVRAAEIKKNYGAFQISLVCSVLFHETVQTA